MIHTIVVFRIASTSAITVRNSSWESLALLITFLGISNQSITWKCVPNRVQVKEPLSLHAKKEPSRWLNIEKIILQADLDVLLSSDNVAWSTPSSGGPLSEVQNEWHSCHIWDQIQVHCSCRTTGKNTYPHFSSAFKMEVQHSPGQWTWKVVIGQLLRSLVMEVVEHRSKISHRSNCILHLSH